MHRRSDQLCQSVSDTSCMSCMRWWFVDTVWRGNVMSVSESGLYLASNRCNQVCAVHINVCSVFTSRESSITSLNPPATYPFPLQSIPWICFLNDKGPKSQFAAATSPLDMTRPGSLLGWNLLALAPGAEWSPPAWSGPGITSVVSGASSVSVSGLNLSFSPRLIIWLRAGRSRSEINTKSLREIKTWGENILWAQQQTTSRSVQSLTNFHFSSQSFVVVENWNFMFHIHNLGSASLSLFSLTTQERFLEAASGKICMVVEWMVAWSNQVVIVCRVWWPNVCHCHPNKDNPCPPIGWQLPEASSDWLLSFPL